MPKMLKNLKKFLFLIGMSTMEMEHNILFIKIPLSITAVSINIHFILEQEGLMKLEREMV